MTKSNQEIRDILKALESDILSILASQPQEDVDCKTFLLEGLRKIANKASTYFSNYCIANCLKHPKKIFVCSAYRGDIDTNIKRCKEYCRSICMDGNIPIAPHLYFPQFLEDTLGIERDRGIECGLYLLKDCDEVWVFNRDDCITEGMKKEIDFAKKIGKKVVIMYKDTRPLSYEEYHNIVDPINELGSMT